MSGREFGRWFLAAVAVLAFSGCGGDGGSSSGGGSTGTLSVGLVDATLPGFQAIYVTIDEVQVHAESGGGWVTVGTPRKTVDLLTLINGVRLELGVAELPAGHYTQMRLLLAAQPDGGLNLLSQRHRFANYFIDESDAVQELKVPSGLQTGIKIVNGFDINADQTTELLLDFEAARSVVKAGSSGQWLLKPTIKVLDTADYSIVSGTVRNGAGLAIPGVIVSAQSFAAGPGVDPRDEVIVHAATVTGGNGGYKLFLAPGSYNLVAFRSADAEAYGPGCTALTALADTVHGGDFTLGFTDQIGTIAGTVTIASPALDQHATLALRRSAACGATTPLVEVASINVAAGGNYSLPLPAATYRAVGWSFGRATQVADPDPAVTVGVTTTVDFSF